MENVENIKAEDTTKQQRKNNIKVDLKKSTKNTLFWPKKNIDNDLLSGNSLKFVWSTQVKKKMNESQNVRQVDSYCPIEPVPIEIDVWKC